MKKLLAILLSTLCLFSIIGINVCADEETTTTVKYPDDIDESGNTSATTTIKYEVNGSYEWTVPSSIDENKEDQLKVSITKCNITDTKVLNIRVKSEYSWKMKKNEDDTGTNYVIKSGNPAVAWTDDAIVLSNLGTNVITETPVYVIGTFAWNSTAPTAVGVYEDILTFTASIDDPIV